MGEESRERGSPKRQYHYFNKEETRMCSCSVWGLLRFVYAITGYFRIGFFVARAVDESLYSFPSGYHHEFLISGVDMIVISFFICAFSCCPFCPIFTLALVFIIGVFVESFLAIYFNYRLLTSFRENDNYKLQVIRALIPFSFLLHIILACLVVKQSHLCGNERRKK